MTDDESIDIRIVPERSQWRVHLMNGVTFTPNKDCEPNWFHRKMQELAFGLRWEKVP